jgi:hypothetical protein
MTSDYSFKEGSYLSKNDAIDHTYRGLLAELGEKTGLGSQLTSLVDDIEGYRVMGIEKDQYVLAPVGERTMSLLGSKQGAQIYQQLVIELPVDAVDKIQAREDPSLVEKYEGIFEQIAKSGQK